VGTGSSVLTILGERKINTYRKRSRLGEGIIFIESLEPRIEIVNARFQGRFSRSSFILRGAFAALHCPAVGESKLRISTATFLALVFL
jgi:hypothetical protein